MNLSAPLSSADLAALRTGDIVYYSGLLFTGRDAAHSRHVRQGVPLPLDTAGFALYHAGPIARQTADSGWEILSAGPTTSMRMEEAEAEFIASSGVKLIVGKGGMGPKTAEACKKHGVIYAVFPGGCAVLAAERIEAVEAVHWLDLGMAEAVWALRVRNFGPLTVSIDTKGNSLFENSKRLFDERKERELEKIRDFFRRENRP